MTEFSAFPVETTLGVESPSAYIAPDRRHALAAGQELPDRTQGAALFADISGFTPLTETLTRRLGPGRGSEEITSLLNRVYDAVLVEVHRCGGSAISFSGDAVTCWFEGDQGLAATAAGLAMQRAMDPFRDLNLAIKIAITSGPARRFPIGDPKYCRLDVLAGATIDTLACIEKHAVAGEVVLDEPTAAGLGESIGVAGWRVDSATGERFALVDDVAAPVQESACRAFLAPALAEHLVRPWLLPAVYDRLRSGQGEFLAELRPVVTLFLNFTGIDYDDDPDAFEKLDGLVRNAQATLAEYDGTLLQAMFGDKGSTLCVAFGAPIAHEDDAAQAARAALDLIRLPQRLTGIDSIRIGVSRGIARTGAYGGRARRTYGVLGDAVNIAARLMQAAGPGEILVTREVQQLLAGNFSWQAVPNLPIKGKSDAVAAYSLLSGRPKTRQRSPESMQESPIVGRTRELALVYERLALALTGQGQVVGIVAEPGLGKTRLVAEIVRQASPLGWQCHTGECSPSGTNTGYHGWHPIWSSFFSIEPSWSLSQQLRSLEASLLQMDPALVHRLPLLGAALDLPIPDNELTALLDAKLRKSSLEALLVDCLRARSKEQPVLLVLEDCHWLDPLSHDLLEAVAKAIVDLPVCVLLDFRTPQLAYLREPRVSSLAHYRGVELTSLTPADALQMIQTRLALDQDLDGSLPTAVVAKIVDRAEGNPFYIEQLIDYLIRQRTHLQSEEAKTKLDIPETLQGLVLSHIDQLEEHQRTTLKVASVIGRVFDASTLWSYYPPLGGESRVRQTLVTLKQTRLTEPIEDGSGTTHAFRHALIQEVAYESLPFSQRAVLHEALAHHLERACDQGQDQALDQLAYHFGLSDNIAKKRQYLLRAGQRALKAYANSAAIDYFERALPLLEPSEQGAVLLDLGSVQERVGRWQDARVAYDKALLLCIETGDRHQQAHCEAAIGQVLRKQGRFADAAVWLAQAEAGFVATNDPAGIGQTLQNQGALAAHRGDRIAAQRLFERSLAVHLELGDMAKVAGLYSDLGILARQRGDLADARALYERSLAVREELKDPWTLGISLNNLGNLALVQDDLATARSQLEKAQAIFREVGDRWAIGNTVHNLGNVAREQNRIADAMTLYNESLSIYRELGDRVALGYLFEDIGCLAARQGAARRALHLAGAAAALRESIGAPLSPSQHSELNTCLAKARHALSDEIQISAIAEGRAMSIDQALELASFCTEG